MAGAVAAAVVRDGVAGGGAWVAMSLQSPPPRMPCRCLDGNVTFSEIFFDIPLNIA